MHQLYSSLRSAQPLRCLTYSILCLTQNCLSKRVCFAPAISVHIFCAAPGRFCVQEPVLHL
jgi:hypothetical protein